MNSEFHKFKSKKINVNDIMNEQQNMEKHNIIDRFQTEKKYLNLMREQIVHRTNWCIE